MMRPWILVLLAGAWLVPGLAEAGRGARQAAAGPATVQLTTKARSERAHGGSSRLLAVLRGRGTEPRGQASTVRAKVSPGSLADRLRRVIRAGDTPSFELLPVGRARMTLRSSPRPEAAWVDAVPVYDVSRLGPKGILRVRAYLPTSGHVDSLVGNDPTLAPLTKDFARTGAYDLTVRHADGSVSHVPTIPSAGAVTVRSIALPLKPGRNWIDFVPRGSGGIPAFVEGRRKALDWDGT